MIKTIINPWKWQDNLGYSQAIEVRHSEGTLYCSGQTSSLSALYIYTFCIICIISAPKDNSLHLHQPNIL